MSTLGLYVLTCMCDDKDCQEVEVFRESNRMTCLQAAREKDWLIKANKNCYCSKHRLQHQTWR